VSGVGATTWGPGAEEQVSGDRCQGLGPVAARTLVGWQDLLAHPDGLRRDLDVLVLGDELHRQRVAAAAADGRGAHALGLSLVHPAGL